MQHLWTAIAAMGCASVATFFLSVWVLKNASRIMLDILAVITLLLIGAYVQLVWGQLWIVQWIPLASVIVLSNWFPILLAVLAAILWLRLAGKPLLRRAPAQLALIGITIWSVVYVIPRTPPECQDEWIPAGRMFPWRVCRQTTPETCSAAATATLLDELGIAASEREMAQLCLTQRGTTWLGIYHGLSVKLEGTGRRVEFFEGSVEELIRRCEDHPVLLCCELTDIVAAAVPEYQSEAGWIPGVLHSVVCFGTHEGEFLIGDPSQKQLERWSRRDIINLWTGMGLTITDPVEK
ncbi:MAG: hypothetical protein JNL58_16165 [Planctomyces sp.]|nr:hypothetical protein [Planctomyces sp.]